MVELNIYTKPMSRRKRMNGRKRHPSAFKQTTIDTDTGLVDSTPVGHKKMSKKEYDELGRHSKSIKTLRDKHATKKFHQEQRKKSNTSDPVNLGGTRPTMGGMY